jgi:Protein of unknown function (DUF1538)
MELVREIGATAMETLRDVVPIVLILVIFQFAVLGRRPPRLRRIAIGFLYMFIGLTLFLVGLEQALFPIGRTMARQLTAPEFIAPASGATAAHWWDYAWVYAFAFAVAFATTVIEPALIAVTLKAHEVSGGAIPMLGLRVMVALGVATGVAVGTFRIVTGTPLPFYILAAYAIVLLQTLTAPRALVPVAYDSGGVATSTVTVPVVTALGLGLAAAIPGRNPLLDGFGLIAFACLFPIMSVLAYAWGAEHLPRAKKRGMREKPE